MAGDLVISTINGQAIGTKNVIIDGNFNVNQRGVSGTVTLAAGAYGHDRWKGGASGCTYTFATSANVTTLTISAGSLIQVVEGLNLQSGTYTLSFSGTAQGKINGGSYSASNVTGTATGGTNMTIEFNTGTLSLVQLEKGSTATAFDYRPYGTELALCQRYYEIARGGQAIAGTTAAISTNVSCAVEKRAAPTVTLVANLYRDNTATTSPSNASINVRGSRFIWTPSNTNAAEYHVEFSYAAEL
jgi:hypothetical protein